MPDPALPVATDPAPTPRPTAVATSAPLKALTGLAGVTTFDLTFGPYRDVAGTVLCVGGRGRLVAVDANGKPVILVHPGTGTVLLPQAVPITIDTAGAAVVSGLPFTDTTALSPSGFRYRVQWDIPVGRPSPPAKTFAAPSGTATVDYDQLPAT